MAAAAIRYAIREGHDPEGDSLSWTSDEYHAVNNKARRELRSVARAIESGDF